MKQRATSAKRAELEKRYAQLKQIASYDPKKIDELTDRVSEDDANIQSLVENFMGKMEATDGAGKYKVPAPSKFAAFKQAFSKLVHAFELDAPKYDSGESAEEEAHDLHDPALHMVEDLEHEVRTLDDATLEALVEEIEKRMKEDLKHEHFPQHEDKEDMSKNIDNEIAEKQAKLAALTRVENLVSASKAERISKAAQLRALADLLEHDDKKEDDKEDKGEKKDFAPANPAERAEKSEELKDGNKADEKSEEKTAASAIKQFVKQIIAELAEEKEDDDKEDKSEKKEDSLEKSASEDGKKPAFLEEAEKKAEEKEGKEVDGKSKEKSEDAREEKKARLVKHLASLRKLANIDGRKMSTPKEVTKPEGTSEDELKGDAKIQYFRATGGTPPTELFEKREKVPEDKEVAGTEEANEIYFGDTPESKREVQTTSDSATGVTNKRVLKDMEVATKPSHPASVSEIDKGDNNLPKEKDWESEKAKADTTPSGPRLKGLEASHSERAIRALRLVKDMHKKGMVNTEDQFEELVEKYASFDDERFALQKEVVDNTPSVKRQASTQPALKKAEQEEVEKEKHEDDEKEPSMDKEAGGVRRKGENRRIAQQSTGLTRPITSFPDEFGNSGKSGLKSVFSSMPWTDSLKKLADLENNGLADRKHNGATDF